MPQVKFTNQKGLHQVSGRGVIGLRQKVELLSDAGAATTIRSALTVDESGKIFLVPNLTTGTQTLSLPALSEDSIGCSYRFLVTSNNSTAAIGQIFNLTTPGSEKIIGLEPKGDGDNTAAGSSTYDVAGFTASAVMGSAFTITCISTTAAIAWVISDVVDGLAANTGSINLA